jgi:hypothetical protein
MAEGIPIEERVQQLRQGFADTVQNFPGYIQRARESANEFLERQNLTISKTDLAQIGWHWLVVW